MKTACLPQHPHVLSHPPPSQNAKVTIKISDRNKMDPHTHEREVSITGTYAAIQLACAMISEKLSQNKPRMSYASDTHDDEVYDENGGQGGHYM